MQSVITYPSNKMGLQLDVDMKTIVKASCGQRNFEKYCGYFQALAQALILVALDYRTALIMNPEWSMTMMTSRCKIYS